MNPAISHVLQFFKYDHLPLHLQEVSKEFYELAVKVSKRADNPETTVALRKLLEAKDAAVRAMLPKQTVQEAAEKGFKNTRSK